MSQAPAGAVEEQRAAAAARTKLLGVLFGLGAAAAYGTSQVIARHSVQDLAPPLVGTMLALAWGTLGFAVLTTRQLVRGRFEHFRRGALYFAAGGIFSAMGVMLLFEALSRGQVVVVSPIAATNPLFTLFFAAILLRGVERITVRILLGAGLVVAGVVVLTIF